MNQLLTGGPIAYAPIAICAVEGGYVGVQEEIAFLKVADPITGQQRTVNTKVRFRGNLSSGQIEIEGSDTWLTGRSSDGAASKGLAYVDQHKLVNALTWLKRCGKLPSEFRVFLALSRHDFDDAYIALRRAHEIDSSNEHWIILFVCICELTNRAQEARSILSLALLANPESTERSGCALPGTRLRDWAASFRSALLPNASGDIKELGISEGPQGWIDSELDAMLQANVFEASKLVDALGSSGVALADSGNFHDALECFRIQEWLSREVGDREHLQMSLGDQALVLTRAGEHQAAMELLREREAICEDIQNLGALAHCIGGQAIVAENSGDFQHAIELWKRQEAVYRSVSDFSELAANLHNQALVMEQNLHLPASEGLRLIGEALDIVERHGLKHLKSQITPFAMALARRAQKGS